MDALLGRKMGMTQIFDQAGEVIPITVVEAGPCYVTQVKTPERDGYAALQVGFAEDKRLNKPLRGHLKSLPPLKHLREIRVADAGAYQIGQRFDAGLFQVGDVIHVSGVSKGKGTAGVVKRHGFRGGPKTHGQSDRWRRHGSIGSTTTPGRVYKGMRMAGRMGNQRVTVRNLKVVLVDPERNLIGLRGAIPGIRGGLLLLRRAQAAAQKAKSR
ncbi:MAG: 50S ribosomal protein L3 [Chloroflexi bacterium]|nr:50S ribosomal protein L3 [Chloroflexota bacterium]